MCILLLFLNRETLSYKDLSDATEIPASDLKRSLLSLTMGKYAANDDTLLIIRCLGTRS